MIGNMAIALVLAVGCAAVSGPDRVTDGDKEGDVSAAEAEEVQEKRVVLEGVDRYRVPEPLFECVRVVLSHRGAEYSTDYIQGISGAAFRIAGICPCAPTCNSAMETPELVTLLGYEMEHLVCEGGGWERGEENTAAKLAGRAKDGVLPDEAEIDEPDVKELRGRLQDLIDRTRQEVREGRPVVFWNAFTTAEFDVVCGYDSEKKVLMGRGSYAGTDEEYAEAPETRAIQTALVGGAPTAVLIGEKVREFDARKAEIAALREAVEHGRSEENLDKADDQDWALLSGMACYDQWVQAFGRADYRRGPGDSYCYGIYRGTHRSAAGFLREIAPRYPRAKAHLEAAAGHFEREADTLDSAESLLWWNAPEGPDAEGNKKVAEILAKARDHYAAGIDEIDKALQALSE